MLLLQGRVAVSLLIGLLGHCLLEIDIDQQGLHVVRPLGNLPRVAVVADLIPTILLDDKIYFSVLRDVVLRMGIHQRGSITRLHGMYRLLGRSDLPS